MEIKRGLLTVAFLGIFLISWGFVSATPTISSLVLNSTTINNSVSDNLTAYATSSDKVIYNWFVNNTPVTIFNMPFDGGTLASNSTCTNCLVRDYALGNNGTLVNGTVYDATGGYDGKGAYKLNGINQSISISSTVNCNDIYSISAWVYPLSMAGWSSIIEDTVKSSGLVMYQSQFGIEEPSTCWTTAKTFGQWYYVVGVANNTDVKIYINGVLDKNCTVAPRNLTTLTSIGKTLTAPYYFNGTIDEITVWNRSLSAQEISALYNNQTKTIVSQELINGSVWRVEAYPNNNTADGTKVVSNNITIGIANNPTIFPQINFTFPTPANVTTQSATNVQNNISIVEANLGSLIYNWNGTNYTMYDSSLVLIMNFENRSSIGENSTYVVDDSLYGNNGTVNGAVWNSSGKYGGAYSYDGINGYINVSGVGDYLRGRRDLTISFWVKKGDTLNWRSILSFGRNDTNIATSFEPDNNGIDIFRSNLSATAITLCTNCLTAQWSYVVLTSNSTNWTTYADGLRTSSGATQGEFNTNGSSLYLGTGYAGYFNGSIDELRIWNRSLSASEVYEQYISNLQKYNQTQWYLNVNQSKNSTTGLDDGNYTYQAFVTDSSGNSNQTEQRTIIIKAEDTTYPIFSGYYDNNGTINNSGLGVFNITLTNTNGTVILEINNTNITATNLTSNIYNASYSFISNGTYSYKWHSWGNGTNKNYNSTTRIYVVNYLDTNYPIFSNYSDNNASLSGSGIALFNTTIINTNGTVWLSINNTNYTATNLTSNVYNVSLTLTTGTYNYTWNAYGNGSGSLFNNSRTIYYTVNATAIAPQTSTTSSGGVSYCITKWNCTEWSSCINGNQTRTCYYPKGMCKPEIDKPIEKQTCVETKVNTGLSEKGNTQTQSSPQENTNTNVQNNTGVSLGKNELNSVNGNPYLIYGLIVLIILVMLVIFFLIFKKRKRKKLHSKVKYSFY